MFLRLLRWDKLGEIAIRTGIESRHNNDPILAIRPVTGGVEQGPALWAFIEEAGV